MLDAMDICLALEITSSRDWTADGVADGILNLTHTHAMLHGLHYQLEAQASKLLLRHGASMDEASAEVVRSEVVDPVESDRSKFSCAEPHVVTFTCHIFVLWKPPGWAVTVGHEEVHDATMQESNIQAGDGGNAGLEDKAAKRQLLLQDWVAQRRHKIGRDAKVQHGILHRLDRDTSGLMACAASYQGYFLGRLQFGLRRVLKEYVCLCFGAVPPVPHLVNDRLEEVRMSTKMKRSIVSDRGSPACTEIEAVAILLSECGQRFMSLVQVRLHTGKLHQIRAHLAHLGHPLAGDWLYGGSADPWPGRIFLHARRLALDVGGESGLVEADSNLPTDLAEPLAALHPASGPSHTIARMICCTSSLKSAGRST